MSENNYTTSAEQTLEELAKTIPGLFGAFIAIRDGIIKEPTSAFITLSPVEYPIFFHLGFNAGREAENTLLGEVQTLIHETDPTVTNFVLQQTIDSCGISLMRQQAV